MINDPNHFVCNTHNSLKKSAFPKVNFPLLQHFLVGEGAEQYSSPNQGRLGGVSILHDCCKSIPIPTPSLIREGSRKAAFTLAEVLITLGVIGVVSAITMPTLIKNYQQKVMVERIKTTYSIISQAVKMSEVDNGSVDTWDIPHDTNSTEEERKAFCEKYFKPYFKNIKECDNRHDCFGDTYYYLNGEEQSYSTDYRYSIILANGVACSINPHGGRKGDGLPGDDIQIFCDINGKQKPNTIGKDIGTIIVNAGTTNDYIGKNMRAGTVHFFGQGNDNDYLLKGNVTFTCNANREGSYCWALIMQNGWKITKDFPY